MKRILVTGGAGYIGSHTAKALAGAGFEPVTFDNLSTGHRWAVRWGPLVIADLADQSAITDTLRRYRIDAVIHFAANAYVGESMDNPIKYFRNNVVNSLNLLESMISCNVRYLIFSSSCAVYGNPSRNPISEDTPTLPVNPYGESKLCVERVLAWYASAYDLRWVSLRYFNAAGADPDGEIGEVHEPETHLIPLVIQAALGRRPWVEVFGIDYPTADGTAIRDYVHVTDLADAHVRALHYLMNDGKNVVLNLGTGTGYSVREVISMVEKVSGHTVSVRVATRRPGDPPRLIADAKKAQSILSWKPARPALDQIVADAFRWESSRR